MRRRRALARVERGLVHYGSGASGRRRLHGDVTMATDRRSLRRTITGIVVRDLRFPTSDGLDGSDAMNADPDYSAAYVVLRTDAGDGLEGHGLTFTIGRGNELCVAAVESL